MFFIFLAKIRQYLQLSSHSHPPRYPSSNAAIDSHDSQKQIGRIIPSLDRVEGEMVGSRDKVEVISKITHLSVRECQGDVSEVNNLEVAILLI